MGLDQQLIAELKLKTEEAERHINHIEVMSAKGHLPEGLDIPSVNELRYAFYHLLKYLTGDEKGGRDALKHVCRAIYDCYETKLHYQFGNFKAFQEDTADILMRDVFPGYLDWAKKFLALQQFINDTPRDSREEYYSKLEAFLEETTPFALEALAVRQEVLKIRADKEKQRLEKEQALKNTQEALSIAQEQLHLSQRTVTIRTIALSLSTIVALGVAAMQYLK